MFLLTSMKRFHTTVFGFAPNVSFSVDSVVGEPRSSMATTEITRAKLLVSFSTELPRNLRFAPLSIIIAPLNAYLLIQGPSSQCLRQLHSILLLLWLLGFFPPMSSFVPITFMRSIHLPGVAAGCPTRLTCGTLVIPLVRDVLDRRGLSSFVSLSEEGGPVRKREYHSSPKSTVDVTEYKIIGDGKVNEKQA